jgi:hypothetical protein
VTSSFFFSSSYESIRRPFVGAARKCYRAAWSFGEVQARDGKDRTLGSAGKSWTVESSAVPTPTQLALLIPMHRRAKNLGLKVPPQPEKFAQGQLPALVGVRMKRTGDNPTPGQSAAGRYEDSQCGLLPAMLGCRLSDLLAIGVGVT